MDRLRGLPLQRWALVALFLAGAAGATSPFTLRFGASGSMTIAMDPLDDPDNVKSYELGFRVGALNGVDGFDMPTPSITPPGGGVPILYFPADAPAFGLSQDFRPPATSQTWQLELVGMAAGSSVTLQWRLQPGGSLDGNALSLVDRHSGAVLVSDMTTTTSYVFTDTDRSLLVFYSSGNHPPIARGDVAAMLQSAGSLQIPFDALLANDYDPDAGDTIEVVAVGAPFLVPGSSSGAAYGSTSLDAGTRVVTYSLPAALPADWTGTVYFPYTIRDRNTDPSAPHEGSATVAVTVAAHLLTVPMPALVTVHPGQSCTVSYALSYTGSLHDLKLSFTLPVSGTGSAAAPWPYGGSYADDAAGTADPTVDSGAATGVVVLDYGTQVPPSGTRFSFVLNVPANAADADLPSMASYRVDGSEATALEQPLPAVSVRMGYTVSFVSAGHGTLRGAAAQLLEPGHRSSPVEALPATGYHFLRWTRDGGEISRANPLTVAGGNADQTLAAVFEIDIYTVSFAVSGNGSLNLPAAQNVPYLGSTAPVTAIPGVDSYFYRWTDGSTDNPRTITGVTASGTYTAEFKPLTPGAPSGHFELFFQNQTGGVLYSIWDLTGAYETTVGGSVLTLALVHHEDGTLGGSGRLQGTVGGQAFAVDNLTFRGLCSGRNGSVSVRGGLTGRNATTAVSLKLTLALAGRTLAGVATGSVTDTVGGKLPVNAACVLDLPAAMDGTYRLPTDLILAARGGLTGTSALILANGRSVPLRVTGKNRVGSSTLELVGNLAADPAFGAIRFSLTVRTYTNGVAGIRGLTARAFGQALSWHL